MSALDKNKIFFGMVKYILSEQKNVDWVFKTSLMSYNGVKQKLTDTSSNEVMNNLIDFIYEIKPYHSQFSEFQSAYEPDMELCNVSCKDDINTSEYIRYDNVEPVPSADFMIAYEKYKEDPAQYPLSKEWMNTSLANRIAYNRVYYNKELPSDEEFHDMTRSDFKGTILQGGEFQSDVFGYDILDYDTDQYDSPTVIYDYCVRDMTEPADKRLAKFVYDEVERKWKRASEDYQTTEQYTYTKEIISVGETNYSIAYDRQITKNDIQILLYKNNTNSFMVITDYNMTYSGIYQIEIFADILDSDTLYIQILKDGLLDKEYVYNAMSFDEQDTDNIKRKIIPLREEITVDEPDPNIMSKRLLVVKQLVNGSRIPFTNYIQSKGKIHVYRLVDKEHIILSAYDYQYLYDVIIKSSDVFGRSNNTIVYSGSGLLRPHFEKDRPNELIVSHGIDSLMINDGNKLTFADFKGDDFFSDNVFIKKFKIADVKKNLQGIVYAFSLNKPYNPTKMPVDFYIDGEIITATKKEDEYFTGLMRAKYGTHLNADTETGTDFDIDADVGIIRKLNLYEKQNLTKLYYVTDVENNVFFAPLGSKLTNEYDIQLLKVGEGVPEQINEDELIIDSEPIRIIGNVKEENNELHIYSDGTNEELLYVIRGTTPETKGTNVYEYTKGSDLHLIGIKHGKYIKNLNGDTIATIKNNQMVAEVVKIKVLKELTIGDVVNISVIQN